MNTFTKSVMSLLAFLDAQKDEFQWEKQVKFVYTVSYFMWPVWVASSNSQYSRAL